MQEQDFEPITSSSCVRNVDAGPSKPKAAAATAGGQPDSDEEDDERPDTAALKALAKQIQRAPSSSSTHGPKRVVIPRRGEKDFEPLDVTANIQEKMLRESRQALFDGLQGVRGTSNKNMSHAIITFRSSYPRIVINRGSLLTTMGQTVRSTLLTLLVNHDPHDPLSKGKQKQITDIELLPEEALYLVERGSLQVWVQAGEREERVDWEEEIEGMRDCIEMSAMEAFDRFIGMEGLSLERYQAYAGLKRLGYTVHRTARFLPPRFRKIIDPSSRALYHSLSSPAQHLPQQAATRAEAATRAMIHTVLGHLSRRLRGAMGRVMGIIARLRGGDRRREGTLLGTWTGTSYGALYQKLRIIPRAHPGPSSNVTPLPLHASNGMETETETDAYSALEQNPYIPFFHVWKPNTHWTRSKWDKSSPEGLLAQPPAFYVGIVDARSTTFPTLDMLESIFEDLPHQEAPRFRPRVQAPGDQAEAGASPSLGIVTRIWSSLVGGSDPASHKGPQVNTFAALKQGDRTLVTAVNDGGNIGWMRFGRGTFEEHDMVTLP